MNWAAAATRFGQTAGSASRVANRGSRIAVSRATITAAVEVATLDIGVSFRCLALEVFAAPRGLFSTQLSIPKSTIIVNKAALFTMNIRTWYNTVGVHQG